MVRFVLGICVRIWMEKLGWCKVNAALGIAWNTGKIKSQKVFLSSCSFRSSEWVASRIHWGWFLALRHLTLLVACQEEQAMAGKIFSGGQKQRPGSQGRKSLCGTEQMGLWEKIVLVAIYQNCVGFFFSLMLFKIKTFSLIKHASDSSHVCCLCGTYK